MPNSGRFSEHINRLSRHKRVLGLVGFMAFVIVLAAIALSDGKDKRPTIPRRAVPDIMGLDRQLDAEAAWRSTAEGQLTEMDERIRALEKQNKVLTKENTRLRDDAAATEAEAKEVIGLQADVIRKMSGEPPVAAVPLAPGGSSQDVIKPIAPARSNDSDFTSSNAGGVNQRGAPPFGGAPPNLADSQGPPVAAASRMVSFELSAAPEGSAKDTKFYVPTGSFAPGVVIAGVSASVGLESQEEPQPGLIRLLGPAKSVLDPDGAPLETDLTGCLVTVVAKGDISAERIYLRPQTMTCPEHSEGMTSKGVVERDVKGFVAGTGKAGIRGPVVIRSGDLVEKALWAGLISELGRGVSNAYRNTSPVVIDGNGTTVAPQLGDLENTFKAGSAAGIGSAADTLAKYYISRLEQIQPVIELAAGTHIEVVFLEGVSLKAEQKAGLFK